MCPKNKILKYKSNKLYTGILWWKSQKLMNHRTLMSEIKELVTMEHSSRFQYRWLDVCETWVSSTLIYRVNVPSGLFVKSNKLFLKLIWRSQKCGVANHNLEGWSWRSGTAQLQFISKSCINQGEMLIGQKIQLGEHNAELQSRSNKYIQLVSGGERQRRFNQER